ncbi:MULTISPECIES: NAD(P)-dependent oxidoreductase [Aliivibrio]|jgi:3-hydroxyisobutyrate dehydrogenase|uniref:NAD(P)-dependent oxidoreductase n=1 Tax=Aliivibrio finisterrensis TaxID=511998 RepID=A0A4V1Z859_9GAMM|nr:MULTISPECIES: NAD(P)-dependent oxidoreductase [Aliivibrio]MDD9180599.1 NAD(P)-dependent oxidoreductase [Aliivibrio sp. A6]RYU47811.1 NAD(P)-dependent oxidoreductase [Aliivibrio finisterrensis]RYU48874.1 NAD(P)-dependent oxidoreductase [Aliivibrio finisterrensis]RYU53830.1 NAD(P)-dependent oxidoreductase [Aliivibrio finisterrensis]RYU60212.1 NAD(P)-dependent oxidoreductase [Aliivibrio finisterrensis]
MEAQKVAFIGLGVMGYPMAGHLQHSGLETTVYNRSLDKALQWCTEYKGFLASSPAEAAKNCDIVFICVGNDDDVRSVVYGPEGVLEGMKENAILVDHTTVSADLAIELAQQCKQKKINFIDAPVSGGQAGAENGTLTIMCGGAKETFDQIVTTIDCYAKQATLLGDNGQGQRCKMVNQICIAGVLKGLSEALLLAEKSNLDIEQVVNVLKHGAAGSWQMENRAVTMAERKFDFGFAIDWMRKDLSICLNEANQHNLSLPMTQEIDRSYALLQSLNLGRMDTSILIKSYDQPTTDELAI